MSTKQLEDFSLREMARKMEARAPNWWSLLGTLLNDKGAQRLGELRMDGEGDVDMAGGVPSLEDDLEDYWDEVDEIDLEGVINALTGETRSHPAIEDRRIQCRAAIKMMKKTIVSGIVMQGINQKSNTLQSILEFFLQLAHTPYKVIDTLARLGISISADAINLAI
ncbi:hypothetical protein PAXRUDRAFT_16606 [Paxillus rubicundulus Ve08.2h10]|uniref:Uncharacterized protein n=1 Tax=Paxillus rubicundulus Ve08.2h10 TaxID=930991 RepID=A0A0D0D5P8_9AGAM|nr:hypothetical protein PAXRUDRAFT_16606 [Paxillus rubicundulus Ve08.2h10]